MPFETTRSEQTCSAIVALNALAALLQFAGDEDDPEGYRGVYIDASYPEAPVAVATNGHSLCFHRIFDYETRMTEGESGFFVPRALIEGAVKEAKRRISALRGHLSWDPATRKVCLSSGRFEGSATNPEWHLHWSRDWRRIVPRTFAEGSPIFAPAPLAAAAKAADLLAGNKPGTTWGVRDLRTNGTDAPALVRLNDDCYAVLMPLRPDSASAPVTCPTWLSAHEARQGAAAKLQRVRGRALDMARFMATGTVNFWSMYEIFEASFRHWPLRKHLSELGEARDSYEEALRPVAWRWMPTSPPHSSGAVFAGLLATSGAGLDAPDILPGGASRRGGDYFEACTGHPLTVQREAS